MLCCPLVVERSVVVVKWRCYKLRNIKDSFVLCLIILRRHAQESTPCDVTTAAVPPPHNAPGWEALAKEFGRIFSQRFVDLEIKI